MTAPKHTLVCDTECYHGFWLVAFKRITDGKLVTLELSDRSKLDREKLRLIMLQNKIVTYNGMGYDMPMIWYAIDGASNEQLKLASDRIIKGNVRYWEAERLLDIVIPRKCDHIDLMEPQPNAFASLKILQGRLHGKRMQDLPIDPDAQLSHEDMDLLTRYCENDLDATINVYEALEAPLDLRVSLGEEYGMDFRSKSDAQIGEAIIKKKVEQATGQRPQRVETPAGTCFPYPIPPYLEFTHPELIDVVEKLRSTQFVVKDNGKVDLPPFLAKKQITIGESTYAMGIGGLHSIEKNRTIESDHEHVLIDFDVASYYPAIILGSGLYPKALGRSFLDVYRRIRDDRIKAKRAGDKVADQGLKIAINGSFGKLGSPYSVLYAPHLLISVTLTGQLALLMLINRAEDADIPVVSANTDGVVFRCPRARIDELHAITAQWESDTGFELESTPYAGLYSQSVNTYIAVKEDDASVKRKGVLANPRAEGDLRTQMMNSPSMNVCADAAVAYITEGRPIEDFIRSCKDIRDFVTVVKVQGGAIWREKYLGKVVRFIWSTDGDPIFYQKANPKTGNHKKVSKTDTSRPVMDLPEDWPDDIDYEAYIQHAQDILIDIGYERGPVEIKKPRVYVARRYDWLAASIAA